VDALVDRFLYRLEVERGYSRHTVAAYAADLRRFAELGRRRGVLVACYGHAGDGNLHANVLWDDPGLDAAGRATLDEMLGVVLEHGGTISGEHGIGHKRKKYMPLVVSKEYLGMLRSIKKALDPNSILNPGKIFNTLA